MAYLTHPVPISEIRALGKGALRYLRGNPRGLALGAAAGLAGELAYGDGRHKVGGAVAGGIAGGFAYGALGKSALRNLEKGGINAAASGFMERLARVGRHL